MWFLINAVKTDIFAVLSHRWLDPIKEKLFQPMLAHAYMAAIDQQMKFIWITFVQLFYNEFSPEFV
jgi:hypothetical protein